MSAPNDGGSAPEICGDTGDGEFQPCPKPADHRDHCVEPTRAQIVAPFEARIAALEALWNLLRYAESQTCRHEETHRGGVLWTICDACGREWADDQGGFQPYEEPEEFEAAQAALTTPASTWLAEREAAAERRGIERAARTIEGGSFLHDEAPTAKFAREAAAAIRALVPGGGKP